MKTKILMGALASILVFPVSAQEENAYFAGRTIEIVVGFTAGGGYDSTARLFARHMGQFLPGNPDILVVNMPGAGSLLAAGALYNTSPRDGTTLGVIAGGSVLEAALGTTEVFDARAFNWIGGRVAENSVCMLSARAPVDTLEDVVETPVIVGASGPGSRTVSLPRLLNQVLGTQFEIITGYPGSSEIAFALETGEVDGQCGIAWGTAKARHHAELESGEMKILSQFGVSRAEDLPDLPLASELAEDELDRQAIAFLESDAVLAFPLLAPPDVPEEAVELLREAFENMLADPDFLADAEQQRMDVDLVTGEELHALIEELYGTPEEIKAIVRQAVAE